MNWDYAIEVEQNVPLFLSKIRTQLSIVPQDNVKKNLLNSCYKGK